MSDTTLLEVRDLKKYFPITAGVFRREAGTVKAVDGVSFSVTEHETLGVVGESGCGKTTLGRLIMRVYNASGGQILMKEGTEYIDVCKMHHSELHRYRSLVQMIFQDPFGSLNPRMTVLDVVSEGLVCNGWRDKAKIRQRVGEMLELCGLDAKYMSRYPHAFSGGQRQRIGVARALALSPSLIIADEPISALDVSVQAQVLNLFQSLQNELGLTYVFIAHDLGVVEHICDRVAVMYLGKLVELADTADLYDNPRHPYTEALLGSIPWPDPKLRRRKAAVAGEVADPSNRPAGCPFHTRCKYAQDICTYQEPILRNIETDGASEHVVACHFAETLQLKGMSEMSK